MFNVNIQFKCDSLRNRAFIIDVALALFRFLENQQQANTTATNLELV